MDTGQITRHIYKDYIHAGLIPGHQLIQLLKGGFLHGARLFNNQVLACQFVRNGKYAFAVKPFSCYLGSLVLSPCLLMNLLKKFNGPVQTRTGILSFYHEMMRFPDR